MRVDWGRLMASTASALALSCPAWAQSLGAVEAPVWPDLASVALGAALMLPLAVPLVAWQRWRLNRLEVRAGSKTAEALRLRECLAASPDGFYCWLDEGAGGEMCSRRLAVLLGLPKGIDSTSEDVLAAFTPEDSYTLDLSIRTLRRDGEGFEAELTMAEGRKREVRRLCTAVGMPVADLVRIAIGPLHLGRLREGTARPLTAAEEQRLYEAVGLTAPPRSRSGR